MYFKHLHSINLSLFDGGAAAGGEGAGAAAPGQSGTSATGETQATPAVAGRGRKAGEFDNVVFGKQGDPAAAGDSASAETQQTEPSVAGKDKEGVATTSDTLEEKRRQFQELVNGEFKDMFSEQVQRIIDRRFKETRGLQEQLSRHQPVMEILMQRYKIPDGDPAKLMRALENDDAYWAQAAEEAGMNVEQYKQFQRMQRENEEYKRMERQRRSEDAVQRQLRQWQGEAEKMKDIYPTFDLGAEVSNPQFLSMLRSGVPVQTAYEVIHMDEIKAGVAQMTAKATEKQVVDGIRAKGTRPPENGTASQSAFTIRDDVHKLTRKERQEIIRRAARGEKISF